MKRITILFGVLTSLVFASQQNLHAQCNAGFSTSVNNLSVQFSNLATGPYQWIIWDYGDGNSDMGVTNPTHVYSQAGIYVACQYIQDSTFTCWDFTCDTLYLGGATCQADFYVMNNGLEVEPVSYSLGQYDAVLWDFGDGSTSTDSTPVHTYAAPGSYTICLSLFEGSNMCDSICHTTFVDSTDCMAGFSYSIDGLTVDFTNESTGTYDNTLWDFGDGSPGTFASDPSHTFGAAGTYEVCLTIYDTAMGNCFSEYCEEITVGSACVADFTFQSTGLFVQCTNTSTGAYTAAVWDFGDGSAPGLLSSHTYSQPGNYEICLAIANTAPFCADEYCETVPVGVAGVNIPAADAGFSVFPNPSDGTFTLRLPAEFAGESISITVLDISGRPVGNFTEMPNAGLIGFHLDVPAGAYYLGITTASSGSHILPVMVH